MFEMVKSAGISNNNFSVIDVGYELDGNMAVTADTQVLHYSYWRTRWNVH
jgi:hypothetical protein